MSKPTNLPEYWEMQYESGRYGWNIGYVSPPLKAYFEQLNNKNLSILVPGAGFGWEAGFLYEAGFTATHVLDFSEAAIRQFVARFPHFPAQQIHCEDFFLHQQQYDLIVEQTFFSGIPRSMRPDYAQKMHQLLQPGGKLVGLLFNHEFEFEGPPYGGTASEYTSYFAHFFDFKVFEDCFNSIKPRKGREIFMLLKKK